MCETFNKYTYMKNSLRWVDLKTYIYSYHNFLSYNGIHAYRESVGQFGYKYSFSLSRELTNDFRPQREVRGSIGNQNVKKKLKAATEWGRISSHLKLVRCAG